MGPEFYAFALTGGRPPTGIGPPDQAMQGRRERGVLCTRATEDAAVRRSGGSRPVSVVSGAERNDEPGEPVMAESSNGRSGGIEVEGLVREFKNGPRAVDGI